MYANRTEDKLINSIEPVRKPYIMTAASMAFDNIENVLNVIASTEDLLERKQLWLMLSKVITPQMLIKIHMKYLMEKGGDE